MQPAARRVRGRGLHVCVREREEAVVRLRFARLMKIFCQGPGSPLPQETSILPPVIT